MADQTVRRVIELDAKISAEALEQIKAFAAATKQVSTNIDEASRFAKSFNGAIAIGGAVISGYKQIASTVKEVVVGTYEFARSLLEVQASLDRLRLGFSSINPAAGLEGAGKTIAYVRDVSSQLGVNFDIASTSFLKLSASAKGTNLEGQRTRDIFETISKVGLNLGLSNQQVERSFLAIEQMISKGVVQNEELRGQLSEALPGAFEVAARAMGVTTSKLQSMMKAGELITVDFLPKFAAQYQKEFGNAAVITDNAVIALTKFDNAFKQLSQTAVDGGLGKTIAHEFNEVSDAVNNLSEDLKRAQKEGKNFSVAIARDIGDVVNEALGLNYVYRLITTGSGDRNKNATPESELAQNRQRTQELQALLEKTKGANYASQIPGVDGNPVHAAAAAKQELDLLDQKRVKLENIVMVRKVENSTIEGVAGLEQINDQVNQDRLAKGKAGLELLRKEHEKIGTAMEAQRKTQLAQLDLARDLGKVGAVEYSQLRADIIKKTTVNDPEGRKEVSAENNVITLMNNIRARIDATNDLRDADSEATVVTKLRNQVEDALSKTHGKATEDLRKRVTALIDELQASIDSNKVFKERADLDTKNLNAADSTLKKIQTETAAIKARTQAILEEKSQKGNLAGGRDDVEIAKLELDYQQQYFQVIDQGTVKEQETLNVLLKQIEALKARSAASKENSQVTAQAEEAKASVAALDKQNKQDEDRKKRIETSVSDALLRGFEKGNGFAKNFVDTLKNTLKADVLQVVIKPIVSQWTDAIDELAKIAIQKLGGLINSNLGSETPIGSTLGKILAGVASSYGFGTGTDYTIGSAGQQIGGGGQRAGGGSVNAGNSYLVGEKGPEYFTPNSSGSMTPMGGGQAVTITIQNNGTPQKVTNQDVKFDARGAIIALITEDVRNNGAIAKSLSGTYGLQRGVG